MSESYWEHLRHLDKESDESIRSFLTKTMLTSREPAERADAAMNLAGDPDPQSNAPAWRAALGDSNARVRIEAAAALGTCGNADDLRVLEQLSKKLFEDRDVKQSARRSVEELKQRLGKD